MIRLVGAILLEQHDEWAVQRARYMTLETIYGPAPLNVDYLHRHFRHRALAIKLDREAFRGSRPLRRIRLMTIKFGLTDNRCILCHSPLTTADMRALTHAPSVRPSHLVLRDGKIAAEITPGHRFCASCHVVQTEALPPIGKPAIQIPGWEGLI